MSAHIFTSRNVLLELLADSLDGEAFNDAYPQVTDQDPNDDQDDTLSMKALSEMYEKELAYPEQVKQLRQDVREALGNRETHTGFNQLKLWLVNYEAMHVSGEYIQAVQGAYSALLAADEENTKEYVDSTVASDAKWFEDAISKEDFTSEEQLQLKETYTGVLVVFLAAHHAGGYQFTLQDYNSLIAPYRELKLSLKA